MSSDDLTRVRYTPRQFLGAEDFKDEQAYHLGMRRRHNIAHHTWGIVNGLELKVEEEDNLFIQPGFAVDGFGRELALPQRQSVPVTMFDEKGRDALDVFLVYDRLATDTAEDGTCEADGEPNRWLEGAHVEVHPAQQDEDYRIKPPGVTEADRSFGAQSAPPDDPARRWPVYLGRFERQRGKDRRYTYQEVLDNRPYAGLVGEQIVTPWSNGTRVELGKRNSSHSRFAVQFGSNTLPVLEVRRGNTVIRAQTRIEGDVMVKGGLALAQCGDDPGSGNWGIYRASVPAPETGECLRVTMGGSGAVIVGAWDADGNFKKCLTISDSGGVTVHGDLRVEGTFVPLSIGGAGALDILKKRRDAIIADAKENAGLKAELITTCKTILAALEPAEEA